MSEFSIDRHIQSDTRFTRGMWEVKQGVNIKWAAESIKTEIRNNSSIYSLASTNRIRNRGDTLNCPSISTTLSSPQEGIIGLESYHHLASYLNSNEPRFDISKDDSTCATSIDESSATLSAAGSISAELKKNPYNIEFIGENSKFLTKLGFRSLGFVEDSRFPEKSSNVNKPSPYMTAQLHLSVGEKIFGLGERFGPFVKNGQRVEIWNEDGGTSSEWSYKNIPFYLSN